VRIYRLCWTNNTQGGYYVGWVLVCLLGLLGSVYVVVLSFTSVIQFFPPPVAIRQYFRKKLKKDKAVVVRGMIGSLERGVSRKLIQRLMQNLSCLCSTSSIHARWKFSWLEDSRGLMRLQESCSGTAPYPADQPAAQPAADDNAKSKEDRRSSQRVKIVVGSNLGWEQDL